MNVAQQIKEQVHSTRFGFLKDIAGLFSSILRARDLLPHGDIGNDRDSVSAKVDRIQEAALAEFTTYEENLLKINLPGFRERTFGISKKREQEIQTYIADITVQIAKITRLEEEIKEIIDSFIGPHADDDQPHLEGSSSSRSSPRLSAGGGKKSEKRRRQSKQTKRRQHKINKQPKLKYTIRRR